MKPFLDYYAILAVPFDASPEEITRAFRTGALKLHPDRNKSPDAHIRFLELKQAYDTLKDPQKRAVYGSLYQLHMQGIAEKQTARAPWFEPVVTKSGFEGRKPLSRPVYTILRISLASVVLAVVLGLNVITMSIMTAYHAPSITDMTLENHTFVNTGGTLYISFEYRSGGQAGYLDAHFIEAGTVVDTQKIDTQNLAQGYQLLTFFASAPPGMNVLNGSSEADAFQVYWCPNYDCTSEQSIANLHFTVSFI